MLTQKDALTACQNPPDVGLQAKIEGNAGFVIGRAGG